MGQITLVLGGTKSGKTSFAEGLAKSKEISGCKIIYLATAQAFDSEMKDRINRHRSDRPKSWLTIEEPLDIIKVFNDSSKNCDLILLDCLTLWLTNMIMKAGDNYIREELMDSILNEVDLFLDQISNTQTDIVMVSNQVEVGLISEYKLGRLFQDIAGLMHQKIGKRANNVIVMQAGFPTVLKGGL